MKASFRVVDTHSQMQQRESAAAKGKTVQVPIHQIVCAGECGTTPPTQLQLGIITEDPNVASKLQLGVQFEADLPLAVELNGLKVV